MFDAPRFSLNPATDTAIATAPGGRVDFRVSFQ